ncbi:MAG: prephenate dehydrogenase [Erysipelotrichaceae bacterium]|nr:prephenate dehydrogenase [Erysipelotrichaceae bacterium]
MISRASKITIIGLGLLGGSYAKGFFNAGYKVTGIDINPDTIEYAKRMHWITEGGSDPSLAEGSDIVISALYPMTFVNWIKENQHYLKPGSILSDVTGIKRKVIDEINEVLNPEIEFIACHPMAGREYKGIAYADCNQFEQANFIIVPTEKNSERAIQTAYDIAKVLKFRNISELTPDQHDNIIGFVSQLCHVIAISLMNISDNPKLVDYTGDSFRDLTRIANINEDLWPELFICNKDNLVKEVDDLVNQMNYLKQQIIDENVDEMKRLMVQATARRKKFGKR